MAENTHLENDKTGNAQQGNWKNRISTTWKMTENTHTRKLQEVCTWKMTEQKMHNIRNDRTLGKTWKDFVGLGEN